jgi:hypothetical protein
LSFIDWISVVSGVLGMLSFIFALWVWMKSDMKVSELRGALQSVYEITDSILWETNNLSAEDAETRLRQSERAIGLTSSIHILASKYVTAIPGYGSTEIGALIKRGIVLTKSMIWNIETSPTIREVWLVTPDLKPDVSDMTTGNLVSKNIKNGKRYVYFFPATLPNLADLVLRLETNLGVRPLKSRHRGLLTLIKLNAADFPVSPATGNLIFFFKTDSKSSRGDAFREIVFTQVSERGIFWQHCADEEAESIYQFLRDRLEAQNVQGTSQPGSV